MVGIEYTDEEMAAIIVRAFKAVLQMYRRSLGVRIGRSRRCGSA